MSHDKCLTAADSAKQCLLEILKEHRTLSEFELLKKVTAQEPNFFSPLPDPTQLYQKHFWLFYLLYQLRSELVMQTPAWQLNISAMNIELMPSHSTTSAINEYNPLAEFYLDLNNLYLSNEEVIEMQKLFWQKYLALDKKSEAIKTLQLTDVETLNRETLKRQFQKLSQRHHPDKGGDAAQFVKIKDAYHQLQQLLFD